MNLLAQLARQPSFLESYIGWLVAGIIVVLGLFVYGLRDTRRFFAGGFARAWAISSVCFQDAIRRKVMILPLVAMVGIAVVSQLQNPLDQQDAIRLDIKFCFFTTALLVTITTIILAATNLPREIENRVIFTIVTKPVTRLEIVIGKLVGFARVSGTILLAMFAFSLVYLNLRAAGFNRQIVAQLDRPDLDASSRAWLEHLQGEGLLNARGVSLTQSFQVFARPPAGGENEPQWMFGITQQAFVRMNPLPAELAPTGFADAVPGQEGLVIALNVAWEKSYDLPDDKSAGPPSVSLQVMDRNGRTFMSPEELGTGSVRLQDAKGVNSTNLVLNPEQAAKLASARNGFIVQIIGLQPNFVYGLSRTGAALMVPDAAGGINPLKFPPDRPVQIAFRGSEGKYGQQLTGPANNQQPVALYQFRNVPKVASGQASIPFEIYVGIEGEGSEDETDIATPVTFQVQNRDTKEMSDPVRVYPENARPSFFNVPTRFVTGNFDVLMRNESPGRVIGIAPASVTLVSAREPFWLNLAKGLAVLWTFSILVAAIAVCCSTKLSWPISIVLTLMILLARWGVLQLDDSLQPGIGAAIASEAGITSAPVARTVSTSVEALTKLLRLVAEVLPDISRFAVTEQIENGVNLSAADVLAPLKVLCLFGLPLIAAAYVFLRNKEVAP